MIKKVVVVVVVVAAAAADCGVLLMRGKICNAKDISMVVAVRVDARAQCLLAQINRSFNRILSKVQKSFWPCTHVNSCQKLYIIYQSTYFIEYVMQGNFKYPRIKKNHQILEKIKRIDEIDQNPLCLVIT